MEAMSAGCIPIVLNIPNNRELIVNEFNGYLFEPNDKLELLVKNVLSNIDKSFEVSKNSVDTINEKFNIEQICERNRLNY